MSITARLRELIVKAFGRQEGEEAADLMASELLTTNGGTVSGDVTFSGDVTIADAQNIIVNAATGTKIGTATTQKIGFFDATPVVQQANTVVPRTALQNLGLVASGGTDTTAYLGAANTFTGANAFNDHITIADAKNIVVNTTTGTKIGTAVGQKIGFWNVTPVVQPSGASQANINLDFDVTGADTVDKAAINQNFTDISTLLLAIRTALIDTGIIKGSS